MILLVIMVVLAGLLIGTIANLEKGAAQEADANLHCPLCGELRRICLCGY